MELGEFQFRVGEEYIKFKVGTTRRTLDECRVVSMNESVDEQVEDPQ